MKIALIISICSLLIPSLKAIEIKWSCATYHLSTSYALIEHDDKSLELQVLHHNGTSYMPISNALITIADLEYLKMKAQVLEKVGQRYTVTFKPDQCQNEGNDWRCFIPNKVNVGGLTVDNLSLKIYKEDTISKHYEYTIHHIDLSLYMKKKSYDMPMRYYASQCTFH
jgi:hypothetical protein